MILIGHLPRFLCATLALAAGLLFISHSVQSQEAVKPCKSARFKSAWDDTIDVTAHVKSGTSCTIRLPLTNVGKAIIIRNPRLGKTEQVVDTADMTFTTNNRVTGQDVFVYEIERTENNKQIKNRIRVEISVLNPKDYPSERAFKEDPLPESSENNPQKTDKPAPAK